MGSPNQQESQGTWSQADLLTIFRTLKRTVVSAAATLTAAQSGSVCLSNSLTGTLYTLPAASVANIGVSFEFGVLLANTSGAFKIITAGGALLVGCLSGGIDATTPGANPGPKFWQAGASDVAVSMNGTTTGGLAGTHFTVTCISATQWEISGIVMHSGTIATPFAAS